MDDQTNPTTSTPKPKLEENQVPVSTGPVMDVKPPEQSGSFGPPVQNTPIVASPAVSPELPAEPAPETSAEETPTMASPASEPSPITAFGGGSYSPETDPNQVSKPPVQAAQVGKKSSGKALKIILIVAIALLLVATATYFYLKNKKASQTAKSNTTNATTQTTTTPVSSKDVANTSSNLDTALTSADGANDTAATDLTDATLGL